MLTSKEGGRLSIHVEDAQFGCMIYLVGYINEVPIGLSKLLHHTASCGELLPNTGMANSSSTNVPKRCHGMAPTPIYSGRKRVVIVSSAALSKHSYNRYMHFTQYATASLLPIPLPSAIHPSAPQALLRSAPFQRCALPPFASGPLSCLCAALQCRVHTLPHD